MQIDPTALIEQQRAEVALLELDPLMVDPLFVAGMLSAQVGVLATIGMTTAMSGRANLLEVATAVARVSAIAQETLDLLSRESTEAPRIIVPGASVEKGAE